MGFKSCSPLQVSSDKYFLDAWGGGGIIPRNDNFQNWIPAPSRKGA